MAEKKDKISIWETVMDAFEDFGDDGMSPKESESAFKGNVQVD